MQSQLVATPLSPAAAVYATPRGIVPTRSKPFAVPRVSKYQAFSPLSWQRIKLKDQQRCVRVVIANIRRLENLAFNRYRYFFHTMMLVKLSL